jgi:hypothetical protein
MNTSIYAHYLDRYGDNPELESCVRNTVNALQDTTTDATKPVLLLGDIQSGKTRGFIGAMALAFDRGYQVAVVFTKGTRALVKQTVNRFNAEFEESIDDDILAVYDIMEMPTLGEWILERQKLIIVVKKEKNNMRRLEQMFFEHCPALMNHRVLVIDDEADFVSIGYRRTRNDDGDLEPDINVISRQISDFRSGLRNGSDYLQVTATPYSLYLQPDSIQVRGESYQPMRPRYTQLLPIHERYIGSTYYFEHSQDQSSPASCIFHPVEDDELIDLDNTHGTIRNNVLRSDRVGTFRTAIATYITGACIRTLQEELSGNRLYKSSFIIHTGTSKRTHTNQEDLTFALINALKEDTAAGGNVLDSLVSEAYEDLRNSVSKTDYHLPSLAAVQAKANEYLRYISIRKINSENEVTKLLNVRTGELKLDGPMNIFIGGQILDRGITVHNLIGFFYGRNPRRMQQDTVMQHCRIFGARSPEDMAVTRLYTTTRIYEAMRRMHESDKALRASIDEHGPTQPVNFMQADERGVVRLCAPNKLMLSNTVTLRPGSRLLPYGFQTTAASRLKVKREWIAANLNAWAGQDNLREPFFISLNDAVDLAIVCFEQFHPDVPVLGCSLDEFIAALRYTSTQTELGPYKGQVAVFSTNDARNVSRIKENRRGRMYSDSSHDGRTDAPIAASCAEFAPCLFLSLQEGKKDQGWKDAPFYWPVLFSPASLPTTIYATNTDDADEVLMAEDEAEAANA